MEKNIEVAEMAKKVMKKLKEKWKAGKRKMIASCGFLEDELRQCSMKGGVTMADSVEGVD